ncbi:hypothetical protein FHR32_006649 [Streptosporangium album]|uniref:Uncharacterized protein n=1 Tax=Streptosporangium album TaxID=47479 RepID=A0A7W7S2X9_9ACTN|nr:hypothetical protein [Streptosporangium album]MBB4942263.1 hypothetical protein [Streptosporangium album]
MDEDTPPDPFKDLPDWAVGGAAVRDRPVAWVNAAAPVEAEAWKPPRGRYSTAGSSDHRFDGLSGRASTSATTRQVLRPPRCRLICGLSAAAEAEHP